jgi:dTDP-4-dehydrorhamnose 3,5-epimerase
MQFDTKFDYSNQVKGVVEFESDSFSDERGEIWTSYHTNFIKNALPASQSFKHDKFVYNKKNVLRGLHGDHKTYKLVMCPLGEVFQVAVDARENSSTYGNVHMTYLSNKNKKSLLLPPGVANGFLVMSEFALYHYKLSYDGEYADALDQFTIKYDDSRFNVQWPEKNFLLSERDITSK